MRPNTNFGARGPFWMDKSAPARNARGLTHQLWGPGPILGGKNPPSMRIPAPVCAKMSPDAQKCRRMRKNAPGMRKNAPICAWGPWGPHRAHGGAPAGRMGPLGPLWAHGAAAGMPKAVYPCWRSRGSMGASLGHLRSKAGFEIPAQDGEFWPWTCKTGRSPHKCLPHVWVAPGG